MAKPRENQANPAVPPQDRADEWVVLGRISGLFGVRGWFKVFSDTQPRTGILDYPLWYLSLQGDDWKACRLVQGRSHGKGIVARLEGIDDRDQAAALLGSTIAVPRSQLPETGPDEYYWTDLEGLRVVNRDGFELGRVDYLFETGANDVMVVKGERERLLPFIREVVIEVSIRDGIIRVDWDPEF